MSAGRVLATQQARDAAKQLLALTGSVKEQLGKVLQQGSILADPQRWDGGDAGKWRSDWGPDASQLKQAAAKLDQLERKAQQVIEDIFHADDSQLGARVGKYNAVDAEGLAEPVAPTSDGSSSAAAMAAGVLALGAGTEEVGLGFDATGVGAPVGVGLAVAGGVLLAAGGIISLFSKKQQAPELTQDEQGAVDAHDHGQPYDQKTYKQAKRKLDQGAKYRGERNQGKQRGQPHK